jgi:hypothetical protein
VWGLIRASCTSNKYYWTHTASSTIIKYISIHNIKLKFKPSFNHCFSTIFNGTRLLNYFKQMHKILSPFTGCHAKLLSIKLIKFFVGKTLVIIKLNCASLESDTVFLHTCMLDLQSSNNFMQADKWNLKMTWAKFHGGEHCTCTYFFCSWNLKVSFNISKNRTQVFIVMLERRQICTHNTVTKNSTWKNKL